MIDIKDSDSIKKNTSPFHFVYLFSGPEKSSQNIRRKKLREHLRLGEKEGAEK